MTGPPRWLIRAQLLGYPHAFRERFGVELERDLRRAWTPPPGATPVRHRVALVVRTLSHGLAERWSALVRTTAWRSHQPHLYTPSGRHGAMWDSMLLDVRGAVRALAAARGFTALAVLALALGIGANGALFAIVDGVLLKPLPYRDADRLVMVWSENPQAGGAPNVLSAANFTDIKTMNRSFAAMEYALSFMIRAAIIGEGDQGLLAVARVGGGMLEMLGAQPQLGRLFGAGERGVAVVSDAMWRGRFGADPAVVGRRIVLSGNEALEIVGVAAAGFAFPHRSMLGPASVGAPQASDLWVPMPLEGPRWIDANGQLVRGSHALVAVARLAPGVTVAQADDDVAAVAATLAGRYPDTNRGWGARTVDLHEQTVGAVRPALLLLLGGAGVLLLMATVNVANLMLARSVVRQRELAVRSALGAGTAQLVRQVMAEGVILAMAGAVVSLGALRWVVGGLVGLAPASLPRFDEVAPDASVVLAASALAVFCGGLLSLVPMWASARTDARAVLQDAGRGATGTSGAGRRLRTALVVGQVALASVLAVQAGLLARSFAALLSVDPGFRADHLLTVQLGAPDHLTAPAQRRAFYDEFFARLRALPGVVTAGGTTRLPLGSTNVTTTIRVEGRLVEASRLPEIEFRRALHDYFGAMRIPIRRGRVFTSADGNGGPDVAVVNDTFVARVFQDEDPIGRRVALGADPANPWMTIVGVVGDVHHGSLEETPPPELYVNFPSNPPFAPFVAIRTASDPDALALSVRQLVRGLDAGATLAEIRSMESIRWASVGERRFTLILVSVFGAIALALAALGVYGVVALVAAERTAELGLRMALGAVPRQVARLVVGDALAVTSIGLVVGLGIAVAVAQLMGSQLYGIAPLDPVTFIAVPFTLALAALAAAVAPAWRAMRLDPLRALNDR
jgi:putative ABC transport system permease protein